MNHLRLPPDISREDAEQDAAEIALRRSAEGYEGSHLSMRVWGDLKDKYGKLWREVYALTKPDRPAHPGREIVVTRRTTGEALSQPTRPQPPTGRGTHIIRNEPGEFVTFDVSGPPESDGGVVTDVRAAVAKLTDVQRFVVEECSLKGRSQADVAAERGVSEQSIKLTLMRARKKLATLLAAYAPEADD